MCWCSPDIESQFCGAVDCHPPIDHQIEELLASAGEVQPAKKCSHLSISVDKQVKHLADTGRTMLHIRVTCADCKAPFLFQGLPTGLDLKGATMDLTGRVGNFSLLAEGVMPRDTGGPTKFSSKGPR